jgi:hypothetical protein
MHMMASATTLTKASVRAAIPRKTETATGVELCKKKMAISARN